LITWKGHEDIRLTNFWRVYFSDLEYVRKLIQN
jgi:hypothetical protein